MTNYQRTIVLFIILLNFAIILNLWQYSQANPDAPVIESIIITTSTGGSAITSMNLLAGGYEDFYIEGEFSDAEGCDTVSSTGIIAQLYRSGAGIDCSADNNDCYRDVVCNISNCGPLPDVVGNYSCKFNLNYYADPTDVGSYESQNWVGWVKVTDTTDASSTATSTAEMASLIALDINGDIAYGNLLPNQYSSVVTTTIFNIGNRSLDVLISGTTMDCAQGQITPEFQEYGTSTWNNLDSLETEFELDLARRINDTVSSTKDINWRLQVPLATQGDCSGVNTINAKIDNEAGL